MAARSCRPWRGKGERGLGMCAERWGNGHRALARGGGWPSPGRLSGPGVGPAGAAGRVARACGSGEPLAAVMRRRGWSPRVGFHACPPGGKQGGGAGGDRASWGAALGPAGLGCLSGRVVAWGSLHVPVCSWKNQK